MICSLREPISSRHLCMREGGLIRLSLGDDELFSCSVHSSQFAVRSSQFAVRSSQFAVRSSQFAVLSSQFAVRSSQFAVRSSQFAVRSSDSLLISDSLNVHQDLYST